MPEIDKDALIAAARQRFKDSQSQGMEDIDALLSINALLVEMYGYASPDYHRAKDILRGVDIVTYDIEIKEIWKHFLTDECYAVTIINDEVVSACGPLPIDIVLGSPRPYEYTWSTYLGKDIQNHQELYNIVRGMKG